MTPKHLHRIYLAILLPLLAAAGCGRSAADQALDRVDAVMESDPELADAMLDSISPGRGADRARHALYRLMATGKLTGAVDNDSLLTLVADRYCTPDAPPSRDAMIANFYRGAAYLRQDSIREASKYLHQAEKYGETVCDTAYLCRIYGNLAQLYQNDYNAPYLIDYARKALEMSYSADPDNAVYDMIVLADAYISSNNTHEGWKWYEKALKTEVASEDSILRSEVLSKYGISKALNKDTVGALRLLEKAVSSQTSSSETLAAYAWMLNAKGDKKKAETFLDKARKFADEERSGLWRYYAYWTYRANGNYSEALDMLDIVENEAESMLMNRLDQNVSSANIELYENYVDLLYKERENSIIRERLGIAVGVLLIIIAVLSSFWIWMSYRKRNLILGMQLDNMEADLKKAEANIKNDLVAIQLGHRNIETLSNIVLLNMESLGKITKELSSKQINQRKFLDTSMSDIQRICNTFFDDKNGAILYSYLNMKYDGVIDRVKEDLGNYQETYLKTIALSLLGMSGQSIALLIKIEYANVRQIKSRFKKRIMTLDRNKITFYSKIFDWPLLEDVSTDGQSE